MTIATTHNAAGDPVRSEALLACRCGREPEHGYDSQGHFYWRGCEPCGIYVSAVTSFGLLRRWRERQQANAPRDLRGDSRVTVHADVVPGDRT